MQHKGGETYQIELRAVPSDVPPNCRLRGLLKAALRTWGLRCLSVREVTPPLPPLTDAPADAPVQETGEIR